MSALVKKAVEVDVFSAFNFARNCDFNILQFADNTLLVGNGNLQQVWALNTVLSGLEVVSGLGVNFHKSRNICIHLSFHFMTTTMNFLNCNIENKPFHFLGFQIGANHNTLN